MQLQQSVENKIYEKRFLLLTLGVVAVVNTFSNYLGEHVASITGSYVIIIASGTLVVLSLITNHKFGITGKHGIAWVMFTCFAASWFAAETIWVFYDVYLQVEPFPSIADVFYVVGYPFLFVFMLFYLEPVKKGISKRMIAASVSITAIMLAVSIATIGWDIQMDNITDGNEIKFDILNFAISLIYPILDAIVLVPAIVGLMVFFKGQVSFLWSLMCFAIVSVSIADAAFVIGHLEDFYHTGHYIDIFFLWPYVLMSFGIRHHYSLFHSS